MSNPRGWGIPWSFWSVWWVQVLCDGPGSMILHALLWESIACKVNSTHWFIHSIIFKRYFNELTMNYLLCWMLWIQQWISPTPFLPSWSSESAGLGVWWGESERDINNSTNFILWLIPLISEGRTQDAMRMFYGISDRITLALLCSRWQGADPCRLHLGKKLESRAKGEKSKIFLFHFLPCLGGVFSMTPPWP